MGVLSAETQGYPFQRVSHLDDLSRLLSLLAYNNMVFTITIGRFPQEESDSGVD